MTTHTTTAKVNLSIRCRPFLPHEEQDDTVRVHRHDSQLDGEGEGQGAFVSVTNPRDTRERFRFPFRSCWDETSTQEAIFDRDVRPILEQVLLGYNACIFCYGVTSSGKTHTMQGSPSAPGIIPRVVRYFLYAGHGEGTAGVHVSISYMEIYKDEVYDLLVQRAEAPKLPVREAGGEIFVANLTETPVKTIQQFEEIFSVACGSRSTGATLLNRASSRSHAILAIRVRLTRTDGSTTEGKINLIDLAGSENNKLTGNDPSRMAESSAINRSLSVLGQVVDALNRNLSRVPYRDSKLTRILQPFLGGSGMSLLICNIAPGAKFGKDTLNTLNFANRSMEVENRPVRAAATMAEGAVGGHQRRYSELPRPRTSMLPAPPSTLASKVPQPPRPRTSMLPSAPSLGPSTTARPPVGQRRRPSGLPGISGSFSAPHVPTLAPIRQLGPQNEAEAEAEEREEMIECRIKQAVEREVARIVHQLESERAERELEWEREKAVLQAKVAEMDVLRAKVEELERINAALMSAGQGEEHSMSQILSPDGNKKVAQALVAMARAAQDKGHLDKALESYRRALRYVPANRKLQLRIEEVQSALEQGKSLREFKRERAARAGGNFKAAPPPPPFLAPAAKLKRNRTATVNEGDDSENNALPTLKRDVFGSITAITLEYAKGSPAARAAQGHKKRKSNNGRPIVPPAEAFYADADSPLPTGGKIPGGTSIAPISRSRRVPLVDVSFNTGQITPDTSNANDFPEASVN